MNRFFIQTLKKTVSLSVAVVLTITAMLSCPYLSSVVKADPIRTADDTENDSFPELIEKEPEFVAGEEPSEFGFIDPGYRFGVPDDWDPDSAADEAIDGDSSSILMKADKAEAYSLIDANALFPELGHTFATPENICVSPVRSQGSNGLCWVFAPLASAESALLKSGKETDPEALDLSELQAAYYAQFRDEKSNPAGCEGDNVELTDPSQFGSIGGNDFMFISGAARWVGIADEADVPYSQLYSGLSESLTDGSYATSLNKYVLRNADILIGSERSAIKDLIQTGGAVSCWVYYAAEYYNNSTCALYCSRARTTNHEGAIVGWDDNYPRENFKSSSAQPSRDGAWLVKNSWGKDSNRGGYYWISYEDAPLAAGNVFAYELTPVSDSCANNYQHDGGLLNGYEMLKSKPSVLYVSNQFTAESYELLRAVSFFTKEAGIQYEVSVYTDTTPYNEIAWTTTPTYTDGRLTREVFSTNQPVSGARHAEAFTSGTFDLAGYHTVDLAAPVALAKDQTFSIVIKLKNPSGAATLTYERPINNSSFINQVSCEPGESYYSTNGTTWYDFGFTGYDYVNGEKTQFGHDGNLRIKAFTDDLPLTDSRLSGSNRYKTMAQIAEAAFPDGADEAVIVTGENFPDALAAAPYAGAKHVPLLITSLSALNEPVETLLRVTWHQRVKRITFIGGNFSFNVKNALRAKCGVEYIDDASFAGRNRYETAESVCRAGLEEGLFTTAACAVTTGQKPPDAMAMSPWSYHYQIPVLLVKDGTARSATSDLISRFDRVYALGDESVVNASVFDGMSGDVVRLAGKNRFETALIIADYFSLPSDGSDGRPAHEASYTSQIVFAPAPDQNFPDALTGAMLAGRAADGNPTPGPIVLVGPDSVHAAVKNYISRYDHPKDSVLKAYFLGAVPAGIQKSIMLQFAQQLAGS